MTPTVPDDLRAAAERVVDAVVLGEYNAAALLDVLAANPAFLAWAVRTACEPGWAIVLELSPGGEVLQVHRVVQRPRPDVAALLKSTGEGAGDG